MDLGVILVMAFAENYASLCAFLGVVCTNFSICTGTNICTSFTSPEVYRWRPPSSNFVQIR